MACVNPADLAELLKATATAVLTQHGLDTAALPSAVTVERPRNPEHGDYASNLALQLAKKVGANPRELAGWLADALAAGRRHRLGGDRRARLHQPAAGRLGAGTDRQQRHRRRRHLRQLRRRGRPQDQPRIRLRQPDRPDSHRRHPLGGGRRRAGPPAHHAGRRRGPRVLLQRPRRADRPVRQLADRLGQGRTHPGRRLRGQLHRRHRRANPAAGAGRAEPTRRRAARDVPAHRRRLDVQPHQEIAARIRHRLRRFHPRRVDAHQRPRRAGHRAAARERQHLREGRRNLVAHQCFW